MSSILDIVNAPAKILLIGKSGAGKTGSLASLVAAGYNLRIIDTDKGIRPLHSLITDPHYGYSKIISARNIDLSTAVRFLPIDTSMKLQTITRRTPDNKIISESLLAPKDARAWNKVINALENWDDGIKLGHVSTWTPKDVLVLDSFSTLARCAYYFSQSMNNRLGARDEGYDYQRDIGAAQSQLDRLLQLLSDSSINCNIIIISHITWVDDTSGIASRPSGGENGKITVNNSDGYPSAIGRALSTQMGKYFNDVYIARSMGSGENVKRIISTVPTEGVIGKNSVYLEREYPVTYGLAEIFARIRGEESSTDLIETFKIKPVTQVATNSSGLTSKVSAPIGSKTVTANS